MSTMKIIFDTIVGHGGAASIDGWQEMARDQLIKQANALSDQCEEWLSPLEAARIADAVIAYRNVSNSNDAHYIREELESKNPLPREIRAARDAAGLSQAAAAARIGKPMRTWQNWEAPTDSIRHRSMDPALFELFLIKTTK